MKEKTVKDHEGKKHPADTARPGGAAYAAQSELGELAAAIGQHKNSGAARRPIDGPPAFDACTRPV